MNSAKIPADFCRITTLVPSPCCTILECISDGVFTIDSERRITSFNRAAETITGFKQEKAVGQYCFDIFRADICEKNCALDRTLSSGEPQINLPARIISRDGDPKAIRISTAVLRNGAGDVIGAVETFRDVSELEGLRRLANRCFTPEDIVGRHPRIYEIISFLPDIAESDSAVIIEGPTGSGKELVARAIHQLSRRKKGPFIALNCAALPDSLLESELFGYTRGAFTGATENKPGRFQSAHKGTLFLDEISNTSLKFQADLLRVLEDGRITPLGSNQSATVDVRIVAASNAALGRLAQEGKFRQDLYYRLNVVKISLPALWERKQDIPPLVDHFIRQFNLRKERDIQGVSTEVLAFLMDYSFPGNVRELENIIEFAFITCKGPVIDIAHLPKELFQGQRVAQLQLSEVESLEAAKIRTMLQRYPNNRPDAARALGISRTTLWRKMKKYGIAVILGGIRMLTAKPPKIDEEPSDSLTAIILWGIPLGIVSGIIGIGGGVLMIPIMVWLLKFKMHQAVGTSTALMIFTAAGGALSYFINGLGIEGLPPYSTGYLNWYQWIILAGVSIPWAVVGANTAHRLPAKQLKYIFVAVMFYMGLKMCGVFAYLKLSL